MFRGVSSVNLDVKGRIAIPTRYRAELQESCERQMVVTIAMDGRGVSEAGCLWLYPLPEWEKLELTISKLPSLNKLAVKLRRFLIGNATECDMDAQGRLLIPEKLRKFADMEKPVVLVGQLNKFEIWNEKAWNDKENELMNGDDISAEDLDEIKDISF